MAIGESLLQELLAVENEKNCMPWDGSGCLSPAGWYSLTQRCREMPGFILLFWLCQPRKDHANFRTVENAQAAGCWLHHVFYTWELLAAETVSGLGS